MLGKRFGATKADLVCAVEGCTGEPEFHLGGGWNYVYRDGPNKTHFLCGEHREKWFEFTRDYRGLWNLAPRGGEDEWKEYKEYWEKVFGVFLKWVKGELDFCPFCGQPMAPK